jgi:crossover junction endodeoxyribonuclease RusA
MRSVTLCVGASPPSVNHYWGTHGHRRFIRPEGLAFRSLVAVAARKAMNGTEPLAGSLAVEIEIYPQDRRKRDLDNQLKCLLDALEHAGVYNDDHQVGMLVVRRGAGRKGGGCLVEVREVPQ